MKKDHIKTYIVIAILISIIGISIAYAALSQQLQIKTTTTVQSNQTSWNIKITNVRSTPHGYMNVGNISFNNTTITVSGIVLKTPSDWAEYYFDVKNEGEVPAKLSSVSRIGPTVTGSGDTAKADADYFLTQYWAVIRYNGTNINTSSPNISLGAGETKTFMFGLGYNSESAHLPTNTLTISSYGYTLNFVQA